MASRVGHKFIAPIFVDVENNLEILSWFFCSTIDPSAEEGGGVLYAFQISNVA